MHPDELYFLKVAHRLGWLWQEFATIEQIAAIEEVRDHYLYKDQNGLLQWRH